MRAYIDKIVLLHADYYQQPLKRLQSFCVNSAAVGLTVWFGNQEEDKTKCSY